MRPSLAFAFVLCALASSAHAVITVGSILGQPTGTAGIRAQAVVKNTTGHIGDLGVTAVGIVRIDASMIIRDGDIQNGLQITKKNLPAPETYGLGLPFGYTQTPFRDPNPPWFGLTWPFRDRYDYFPLEQLDPLADDVGIFFSNQPGVYGFVDIEGYARGGPTDPIPSDRDGSGDPNLLLRGFTGNGLPGGQNPGPATYFAFDIQPLVGPFDRTIELTIFAASARVVVQDDITGAYSEVQVPIADFVQNIQLPEPTLGLTGASLALLLAMRRRA